MMGAKRSACIFCMGVPQRTRMSQCVLYKAPGWIVFLTWGIGCEQRQQVCDAVLQRSSKRVP